MHHSHLGYVHNRAGIAALLAALSNQECSISLSPQQIFSLASVDISHVPCSLIMMGQVFIIIYHRVLAVKIWQKMFVKHVAEQKPWICWSPFHTPGKTWLVGCLPGRTRGINHVILQHFTCWTEIKVLVLVSFKNTHVDVKMDIKGCCFIYQNLLWGFQHFYHCSLFWYTANPPKSISFETASFLKIRTLGQQWKIMQCIDCICCLGELWAVVQVDR